MFFPELYFAYRKMPLVAVLVLILRTIIGFPAMAISTQTMFEDEMYRTMFTQMYPYISEAVENLLALNLTRGSFMTLYNFTNILEFAGIFIFAGFSNYLYYRHSLNKASQIKKQALSSGGNVSFALKQAGGVSAGLLILFIALEIAMQFLSMAAVFLLL